MAPTTSPLLLLLLTVLFCTTSLSTAQDNNCGNATQPLVPGRFNVLLVGDSISMVPPYTPGGYGGVLHTLLQNAGVAVQHAGGFFSGGQCSNTVKGLLCTDPKTPNNYLNYTGGGLFDLVHVNYGLHDLVAACVNGSTGECEEHVNINPPDYGRNLVTLYHRFSTIAKKFMWTSTTPVPNVPTSMGRTYQLAVDYNKQAYEYLSQASPAGLLVNDLWTNMIKHCGEEYKECDLQIKDNVHLTVSCLALLC